MTVMQYEGHFAEIVKHSADGIIAASGDPDTYHPQYVRKIVYQ